MLPEAGFDLTAQDECRWAPPPPTEMTMPDTAAAGSYVSRIGEFTRDQRYIATRITADRRRRSPSRDRRREPSCVHRLNPTGIVPARPDLAGWFSPHGRDSLGGRPFGNGTPSPPPPQNEAVPHIALRPCA
jgi:hypothetical protein